MPEGVQRYQRTKMVLPCRVWTDGDRQQGSEVAPLQLAHTLDISPIGGRLGGLRTPVEVGQTLTLQRGQKKTNVRVIWTKQLAPTEMQAGFETLEFGRKIWDVDLPQDDEALEAALEDGKVAQMSEAPIAEQPEIQIPSTGRHISPIAPPTVQVRWVLLAAGLLLMSSLGLFVQQKLLGTSSIAEIHAPVPKPPTDGELAAMTPKPRKILPLVAKATPDVDSSRLKVAEAPQGHVAYPVAPDASAKGKVDLKVVIATDGRVKQIQLRSGKQLLAQAAEQAIRLWRYSQHVINGEPVEAETNVTVSFLGEDAVSLHFPSSTNFAVRTN